METQDILYNVASQTLFYDAPEGRPSAVTSVQIFENRDSDDTTAELATTGSIAIETNPDTTFDAAAGPSESNPKLMPLAATTGIAVGRRYIATTAAGLTEWVEIAAIDDPATASSRHPLHNTFANADTLETTRISIGILDSWAADKNNVSGAIHPTGRYRARWTYTDVNSVVRVADSYFDLVRYPGSTEITPLDVALHIPGFFERLPDSSFDDKGASIIQAAYIQLKNRLTADGKADQLVRDTEMVGYLVALKTDEIVSYAQYRTGAPLEQYEVARDRFFAEYVAVFGPTSALLESRTDDGAATVAMPVGITVR